MTALSELLGRVKTAAAGSEELDSAVGCYFSKPGGSMNRKPVSIIKPRPVTRSIDAAVALVERVLNDEDSNWVTVRSAILDRRLFGRLMSEQLPLAIVAALLTALITSEATATPKTETSEKEG